MCPNEWAGDIVHRTYSTERSQYDIGTKGPKLTQRQHLEITNNHAFSEIFTICAPLMPAGVAKTPRPPNNFLDRIMKTVMSIRKLIILIVDCCKGFA